MYNVHAIRYSVKYYNNGSEVTVIATNDLEEAEILCYQLKERGTEAHIWDNIYNESVEH
jgi:hypothetical protein